MNSISLNLFHRGFSRKDIQSVNFHTSIFAGVHLSKSKRVAVATFGALVIENPLISEFLNESRYSRMDQVKFVEDSF